MYSFTATARKFWIILTAMLLMSACSASIPSREVKLEKFPSVSGNALSGERVQIPEAFAGKPTILVVGYEMNAQFDIDRWALGLLQLKTPAKIYELPTIHGLVPSLISDKIDNGMRKGIPKEDWPSVVTIYEDSAKLVNLTGNTNPRNARIFVLNASGEIVYFYDRGFSPNQVFTIDKTVRALQN